MYHKRTFSTVHILLNHTNFRLPKKEGFSFLRVLQSRITPFWNIKLVSMGTMLSWRIQMPWIRSRTAALQIPHSHRVSGESTYSNPTKTWLPGLLRNHWKIMAWPLTGDWLFKLIFYEIVSLASHLRVTSADSSGHIFSIQGSYEIKATQEGGELEFLIAFSGDTQENVAKGSEVKSLPTLPQRIRRQDKAHGSPAEGGRPWEVAWESCLPVGQLTEPLWWCADLNARR